MEQISNSRKRYVPRYSDHKSYPIKSTRETPSKYKSRISKKSKQNYEDKLHDSLDKQKKLERLHKKQENRKIIARNDRISLFLSKFILPVFLITTVCFWVVILEHSHKLNYFKCHFLVVHER